MNVTPAKTATKSTEAWNVPVTSISKPKTTGITSGPRFPSKEMKPITPPAGGEALVLYCHRKADGKHTDKRKA
jgi:hypothetical protein